jgi:hypothetical protein
VAQDARTVSKISRSEFLKILDRFEQYYHFNMILLMASPQPTADCQSSGGLPPGMALGCELQQRRKFRK